MANTIFSLSLSLLLLAVCCSQAAADGGVTKRRHSDKRFLLPKSKNVVKTDAGEMRIVRSYGGKFLKSTLHVGFISMNPRSLFIPQYLDSSLVLFIRHGEARVAHIYRDELVERNLKTGDIYRIEAGSAFYIVNSAEGEELNVICSIDTSQSLGWQSIQSFFVAGGAYPISILSGFDHQTLSTAFNVSDSELSKILRAQRKGPIVHLSGSSSWSRFLDMKHHQQVAHMRKIVHLTLENVQEKEKGQSPRWSIRKLLFSIFGMADERNMRSENGEAPESYNLYNQKPNFENNYGSSTSVDESVYSPLSQDDISVFHVNLSAGSMMAPHINPRATVYGVVLTGSGRIQIVYPNGSLAMNAAVSEGDVFWVPRYYPYCEIASAESPIEFFGFTTSARNNRPQFLVGANSLLHSLRGPELAAAFGVSNDRLNEIIEAQHESVILPANATPAEEEKKSDGKRAAKVIRNMVLLLQLA